jgi:ankyrin repeat protein
LHLSVDEVGRDLAEAFIDRIVVLVVAMWLLRKLLKSGADVKKSDRWSSTPLHRAANNGQKECAAFGPPTFARFPLWKASLAQPNV